MVRQRLQADLGKVVLQLFRDGLDTIEIAQRLRILKPNGKPTEAKVQELLWQARAEEKGRSG